MKRLDQRAAELAMLFILRPVQKDKTDIDKAIRQTLAEDHELAKAVAPAPNYPTKA